MTGYAGVLTGVDAEPEPVTRPAIANWRWRPHGPPVPGDQPALAAAVERPAASLYCGQPSGVGASRAVWEAVNRRLKDPSRQLDQGRRGTSARAPPERAGHGRAAAGPSARRPSPPSHSEVTLPCRRVRRRRRRRAPGDATGRTRRLADRRQRKIVWRASAEQPDSGGKQGVCDPGRVRLLQGRSGRTPPALAGSDGRGRTGAGGLRAMWFRCRAGIAGGPTRCGPALRLLRAGRGTCRRRPAGRPGPRYGCRITE